MSCDYGPGLDEPEDGMIYVNRYDTRDYPIEVRRSTGLCPQSDVLFDELTVMEHLLLFAWVSKVIVNFRLNLFSVLCTISHCTLH